MAKRFLFVSSLLLCAVSLLTSHAEGKVAWRHFPDMEMTKEFKDIAITLDGRWTFVLTVNGDVLVYSSAGKLEDTIHAKGNFDTISCSTVGDRIYLGNRDEGTLQVLEVEILKEIDTQGAPVEGALEAPIEMVVFSDFECPYCASLVPVLKEVLEKYPGKVKMVFKNFPLEMHRMATPASLAALAAHKQGKFWPYHDKLFENHKNLTEQKFQEIANELKLDLNRFNADMKGQDIRARLNKDIQDGRIAEVRGTPAVFVNGRFVKDRSPKSLQELIDQLLKDTEQQKK